MIGGIVPFTTAEGTAITRNQLGFEFRPSRWNLVERRPDTECRRVCPKDEVGKGIKMGANIWFEHGIPKLFEGSLLRRASREGTAFDGQVEEWPGNFGVTADETTVKPGEAKEGADSSDRSGRCQLLNGADAFGVRGNTFGCY